MWLFNWAVLVFLVLFVAKYKTLALQDVTADLFGAENNGTVAAFGDFNADKQTDIFIIREQSELVIFLADAKAPYFKPKVHISKGILPSDANLTSVVPGDYDGDSQMDVLLTAQINLMASSVFVFWGDNQTLDTDGWIRLNKTFRDQPLVMDFNGDMIPDIFGVTGQATTEYCSLTNRNVVCQSALSSPVNMRIPHANAFIDLNKDLTADLFLTTDGPKFETWISKDGNFTRAEVLPEDPPFPTVGQSSFADFAPPPPPPPLSSSSPPLICRWRSFLSSYTITCCLCVNSERHLVLKLGGRRQGGWRMQTENGDGYQDHLLPVCLDEGCQRSAIYLAKSGSEEWVLVLSDFQQKGGTVWSFVVGKPSQPLSLHLGDYNLDGFPDALMVLRNTSGSAKQAFLLENVPCSIPSCQSVGRMFSIHWDQSDLGAIPNAIMATFFDIYEDGILDMLVMSQVEGRRDLIIHALKNNFEADAYFVKVMVLSGLCSNACPGNIKPLGVNQPGPYVMYTTLDSTGKLKNASAGQLSQSAHFSLQLPYTVLGLGRSANFLDHLVVGIPRRPGELESRKQEWTAIIPNSQLIVIPYPHDQPSSWSAKLYLTPSNSVLLTAIALIGVCVFILVIIGILHWQEKKADDREKRQEAHRFHFDAM
ncbi:T-cell immunomodulatory protein isoform X1 [Dunckerocampus dactyliophorus]|uniref:T-cell immunomodulatory protein isoform X1 n=1 Tax=Dunckerocampus dactyliophorus TaxID=161453 RepID=UPI0024077296|nr:T-cell immunomodulatory protein isoform X1 [Dunckerocampus dactyliophorus]